MGTGTLTLGEHGDGWAARVLVDFALAGSPRILFQVQPQGACGACSVRRAAVPGSSR